MNHNSASAHSHAGGRFGRRTMWMFLALAAALASWSRGGSIFDDDWAPPMQEETRPQALPPEPAKPSAPDNVPPPVHVPAQPTPQGPIQPAPIPTETARRAVPGKAALDHSRTLLKEAFAAQLADRTVPGRHKLAESLLSAAEKVQDNPSDQFALLAGAVNAAKEGACLRLVVAAADEMSHEYQVDAAPVKAAAAFAMPLKADTPANSIDNVLTGLELTEAMACTGDVAAASRLCGLLRAPASADPALSTLIQVRAQELDSMRIMHDRVAPQLERLKTAPRDPAANLAVGSYECFTLGNWPKGLAMLAKGSDAALRKLAAEELAAPTDADAIVSLGDSWWDLAPTQPRAGRAKIQQHAAALYSGCVDHLSALQKLKIEKRINEANAMPSGPATAALCDVLVRQKLARCKDLIDGIAGKPGAARAQTPVTGPLQGDVAWPAVQGAYAVARTVSVGSDHGPATLKLDPGVFVEGGTILVAKGSLEMNGDASKPILLRNVHVGCELGGHIRGSYVIFEDCTFSKEGGWFVATASAKFEFKNCALCGSNFKNFHLGDCGVKLDQCTFAGCKFPDRNNKPAGLDSAKTARHEWSHIADCEFYDCELSASVFWMPERCNFFHCRAADSAVYSSASNLTIELGLMSNEQDPLIADLARRMTTSGPGRVAFAAAPDLYPTQAFPR